MKKIYYLLLMSFLTFSCSSELQSQEIENTKSAKVNAAEIEIAGNNQDETGRYGFVGFWVESDIVSVNGNGCFTVQVRIYTEGTTVPRQLVLNQNVDVGCAERPANLPEGDTFCEGGILKNGDRVLPAKEEYRYCLVELLTNPDNAGLYQAYLLETRELLENVD